MIKMDQTPTIYLLAREPYTPHELALIERINQLICFATPETLKAANFREIKREANKTDWVFSSDISVTEYQAGKRKPRPYRHPVAFYLTIELHPEAGYQLSEVSVIDQMFGQPHFTNEEYNQKIFTILNLLVAQGVFGLTESETKEA